MDSDITGVTCSCIQPCGGYQDITRFFSIWRAGVRSLFGDMWILVTSHPQHDPLACEPTINRAETLHVAMQYFAARCALPHAQRLFESKPPVESCE